MRMVLIRWPRSSKARRKSATAEAMSDSTCSPMRVTIHLAAMLPSFVVNGLIDLADYQEGQELDSRIRRSDRVTYVPCGHRAVPCVEPYVPPPFLYSGVCGRWTMKRLPPAFVGNRNRPSPECCWRLFCDLSRI